MLKYRTLLVFCLTFSLFFCGCSKRTEPSQSYNPESTDTQNTSSAQAISANFAKDSSEMFSDRDSKTDYDKSFGATITLNGSSATADTDAVKICGNKITITDQGTYIISGTLTDGMIIVDADESDQLQLVFDGVTITSKTSAALYFLNADKVFVTLNSGTKNTLSNGGSFTQIDGNNIDAAVFSKQDLTFNGNGSLTVSSPSGHGITCKDDLVIYGGTYTINCSAHGLDVNDSIRCDKANIAIASGKDGFHAENDENAELGYIYIANGTFNIESEGDGISAAYYMQIENGAFNVITGDGASQGTKQTSDGWGGFMGKPGTNYQSVSQEDSTSIKGIKAASSILINQGSFTLNCADDGIHSNDSITVNGGSFNIATGDDVVHADRTLTVTGGAIDITESYEGLEALDIKLRGGQITLTADDDGLNAAGGNDSSGMGGMGSMSSNSNGSIVISGGKLYINASGDGIDANGTLEISGGYTVVCGPTRGDTATLDYDSSGVICGGTFIGTGASGMAQSFSDSQNQGVIAKNVGSQNAGANIKLTDKSGNEIINYSPALDFEVVILSSPDIRKGEIYNIAIGSRISTVKAE